jgi:hypothetical protein
MNTIEHNASIKKPATEITVPSCPLLAPLAPKTVDFPYGMPMNGTKGQVGSSAFVGH